MFAFMRRRKRRRLAERPLPEGWVGILERRVPFFRALSEDQRTRFLDKLKVFVWEKRWEGAGGLELTDEHRVTIAASAVRLVLELDLSHYDRIRSIVVYPGAYRHPQRAALLRTGQVPPPEPDAVLGEVHRFGTVALSWDSVVRGLQAPTDGRDTTVHEFAHALDLADGRFDGLPALRECAHVRPWATVMQHHYDRLEEDLRRNRRSLLRAYGATNPAEFFAVATEAFFEEPRRLAAQAPDLYAELRRFYGWDPETP
jgi:MtfA peptidase